MPPQNRGDGKLIRKPSDDGYQPTRNDELYFVIENVASGAADYSPKGPALPSFNLQAMRLSDVRVKEAIR
jgi:hypothetical protein